MVEETRWPRRTAKLKAVLEEQDPLLFGTRMLGQRLDMELRDRRFTDSDQIIVIEVSVRIVLLAHRPMRC